MILFFLGAFSVFILLVLLDWFGWLNGPSYLESNYIHDYKKDLKRQFISSEEYNRNNNINEILTIVRRTEVSQIDNVNFYKEILDIQKKIIEKIDLYIYKDKK